MVTGADHNRVEIALATIEDWERVRDIRIRALADAPFAFASRWEEEKDKPQSFWRARLERSEAATFLALNRNETVGLVSAFLAPEDATRTELVSMWVARSREVSTSADNLSLRSPAGHSATTPRASGCG